MINLINSAKQIDIYLSVLIYY